jgi:type IV pilus assembly protein PilY1
VRSKGRSNPVLFFGAGYCGGYSGSFGVKPTGVGEDSDAAATSSPSCPTSANGRGVYVVDLGTNATSTAPTVLKFFQATWDSGATISDSVAADVSLLDRDGDGYIDRVYAADTGGTVWRMDVDNASTSNWNLFKFAVAKQLADGSGYREKFFYRPDVVPTSAFDAVLLGSGNREEPLATTTNNRFYMFKDLKTGKDASVSPALTTISNYGTMLNAATATSTQLQAAILDPSYSGWYYPLLTDGEKVVNAPLTIAGTVYFATNRPNAALPSDLACSNLGEARAYRLNYASGESAGTTPNTLFIGGGLPPSPTAGLVQISTGGPLVPFCIGCGPGANLPGTIPEGVPAGGSSPIDPIKIFVNPPSTRTKTFWYNNIDQ